MNRRLKYILLFLLLPALMGVGCNSNTKWGAAKVAPSLEDRMSGGGLYTPSTQSLLRGHHWLESVEEVRFQLNRHNKATIPFVSPDQKHYLKIRNLAMDQLVPRLHYKPASPPDEFDAFNLMLAEFSRNSLSVPVGKAGDKMAHFETSLPEEAPWKLSGDFEFIPNENTRPVRVGIINNCLSAGLWEISATDRSGEIYHAWFQAPEDHYIKLISTLNGIDKEFATSALEWNERAVELRLERLRHKIEGLGMVGCTLSEDTESGFSSQDSRRKLHKGYAHVLKEGEWKVPEKRSELTASLCRMSNFVEPGKYSISERKEFDLKFLRNPNHAKISRVMPVTHYNITSKRNEKETGWHSDEYLEIMIQLDGCKLVIGNLPMFLLVPQQDFVIHGFGVGILSSSGLAERRKYLIEEGAAPSFAYLCQENKGKWMGLNSHEYGIEQIFIRTLINDPVPCWELTITSYERIVDIVKYRINIPESLHKELKQHSLEYIAPLYLTYKDDNLR